MPHRYLWDIYLNFLISVLSVVKYLIVSKLYIENQLRNNADQKHVWVLERSMQNILHTATTYPVQSPLFFGNISELNFV